MMSMSNRQQRLSDDDLRRTQAETGVDVYALLDLMERTPAERLRIAMANAHNVTRLRSAASHKDANEIDATPGAFDPVAILDVLQRREVHFVVIGGVAGFLLGSALPSANLDICFAREPENVRQLSLALNDLNAKSAGVPSALPIDEQLLLRGDFLNFQTDRGRVHCLSNPEGTEGYDGLRNRAERMEIDGVNVFVASLADLIRMKESSNRARDRFILVTLRAVERLKRKT
jgi:hypothetical protein